MPFYNTVGTFSNVAKHRPKVGVVAQKELAPPAVYHCLHFPSHFITVGIREERKSRASTTKTINLNSDSTFKAVHYKPLVDRTKQIERQADVKGKNLKRFPHG